MIPGCWILVVKRYVKNIILEAIDPKGCYACDFVDEVSEKVGKPFSIQRVSSYLSVMFEDGEVRREAERIVGSSMMRYKWFRC